MSTFTPAALREMVERSHVLRAIVVYASACWGVLQGVDFFTQHLGLPDWVFPGAVILLVIGFPLIVATALVHSRAGAAVAVAEEGTAGEAADRFTIPPARPWLTWRRTLSGGAIALAGWALLVGAYMGARKLGIGPVGTLLAKGVLNERDKLLIADFENHSDLKDLGETVSLALGVGLSQSHAVRIATRADVVNVLQRMEKDPGTPLTSDMAREVAEREGMKAVLEGAVAGVGGAAVITARLVSAHDGSLMAEFSRTAARPGEVLPQVDALSREIRDRIGESLKVIRTNPPLYQVTTGSLEALRLYTNGFNAIFQPGDTRGIPTLEQAVALDSSFAMAWAGLAIAWNNVGQAGRAAEATEHAYQHRERLPELERERVEASYEIFVRNDYRAAAAIYEARLSHDPDDVWALGSLGPVYFYLGAFDKAEAIERRAIALPYSSGFGFSPYGDLIGFQAAQGKFTDAEGTFRSLDRRFHHEFGYQGAGSDLAAARGDYETARQRLLICLEDPVCGRSQDNQAGVVLALGNFAGIRGQIRLAEQYYLDAARKLGEAGRSHDALAARLQVYAFERAPAERNHLEAELRRLRQQYPLTAMEPRTRPYLDLAEAYARLGDVGEARRLVAEADSNHVTRSSFAQSGDRDRVLGEIALASGDANRAIERLETAARDGPDCPICSLPTLARAYEALGQRDSALAIYERFATVPTVFRSSPFNLPLGFTYERLSQLYDARGDRSKARLYASRLVELWKDADPELQPRVAKARALLRRLSG